MARTSSGVCAGQVAVGSAIAEHDVLSRIEADFALEQDEVLVEIVLGGDQDLLLRLKLHARAQFVQVGRGAGRVRFVGLVQRHLVDLLERPGVVHFAGGRNGMQVGRGHLLHHLAAGPRRGRNARRAWPRPQPAIRRSPGPKTTSA